jgi:hypothetical protein
MFHRRAFHVCTGSGMAMAWDAFHKKFTKSGHTIFTHILSIHLPFVGDATGVFLAVKSLRTWDPLIKAPILDYALKVCPQSVTGVCYYGGQMAKCQTVNSCSACLYCSRIVVQLEESKKVEQLLNRKFVEEWKAGVLPLLHKMTPQELRDMWLVVSGLSTKRCEDQTGWAVQHFEGSYMVFSNRDEKEKEEPNKPMLRRMSSILALEEVQGFQGPELQQLVQSTRVDGAARDLQLRIRRWGEFCKVNQPQGEEAVLQEETFGLEGVLPVLSVCCFFLFDSCSLCSRVPSTRSFWNMCLLRVLSKMWTLTTSNTCTGWTPPKSRLQG